MQDQLETTGCYTWSPIQIVKNLRENESKRREPVCVCLCVCLRACMCMGLQKPEEGMESPEVGVTVSCELPVMGAGNHIWVPLQEQHSYLPSPVPSSHSSI